MSRVLSTLRARVSELRLRLAHRWRSSTQRDAKRREAFTDIFSSGAWNSPESLSGSGSTLAATEALRPQLLRLCQEFSIRSLLDAPCGDCNWMATLWPDLGLERYIGVDIVEELIFRNRVRFERPGIDFKVVDLCSDELPEAQLLLCRDCLIHLSLDEARSALKNMARSGAEWLLISSDRGVARNREAPTGSWRPLDLEIGPYLLPPPERWIPYQEWEEAGRAISSGLGLWRTVVVQKALR